MSGPIHTRGILHIKQRQRHEHPCLVPLHVHVMAFYQLGLLAISAASARSAFDSLPSVLMTHIIAL
jgi:hypothetical protein